jgi:pimeloyl-ACP methyl ester carboxylesterase
MITNSMHYRPLHLAVLLLTLMTYKARAATYTWDAPRDVGQTADFRLWIPEESGTLDAVIGVIPGRNGDSRSWTDDPVWQECTRRNQCALMGCKLLGPMYYLSEAWSGAVFMGALGKFGTLSSHTELAKLPIALWGHSAGAQWSCSLANQYPGRVIAFVANRGSDDYWRIRPELCRIPALWIAGEKDPSTEIIGNMANAYSSGRRRGALWAFALAPGATHDVGNSREFGIAFLDAVFRTRSASAGNTASPSASARNWTGSLTTHEIAPSFSAAPDKSLDAWLPDETFAHQWHTFVTTPAPSPSPKAHAGNSPHP